MLKRKYIDNLFYIGTGTSVLIPSKFNLATLTLDNFVTPTFNQGVTAELGTGYVNQKFTGDLKTSKNLTNNTISFSPWIHCTLSGNQNDTYGDIDIYLIKKLDSGNVKDLGTGTTFDIKSLMPTSYMNLTIDNFFAKYTEDATTSYSSGYKNWQITAQWETVKHYDNTTGLLTFYVYLTNSKGGTTNIQVPLSVVCVK